MRIFPSNRALIGAIIALAVAAGFSLEEGLRAQVATLGQPSAQAQVPNLNQTDLVCIAQRGVGQVPAQCTGVGVGATMMQYESPLVVPTTGFTLTAPNPNVATLYILNPAGTLATGTLTMPASPNDGGNFCVMSTQTQTALTVTANTGQTVGGTAVTALVAYQPRCWRYIGATSTWALTT